MALALSNRSVQLRSVESLALQHEFHAHNAAIHELWTSPTTPWHVATCSSDETVKFWDVRSPLPALVVPIGSEAWTLDVGCGETLLAVGTDEIAHFFDVRAGGKKLGEYGECHVDAITKVRFHPTQPAFVVTASEDGVVCFSDCRVPDEDDALESIINVESAVTTIGFFGPQRENIFCLTGTETLDLWNLQTAERIHHYDRIRDDCNAHGIATDYLIDCVFDEGSGELFLLSGNHGGDINVVGIGRAGNGQLQHAATLKGGHKACVRTVYYDTARKTLYSGGEDSRVCRWSPPSALGGNASVQSSGLAMAATAAAASVGDQEDAAPSTWSRKAGGLDPAGIKKARKSSRPY